MNELQNALAEVIGNEKTRAKTLLVPSFSIGHQITESLVRSGVPYLNLRISTPMSLAHEVVGLDLARESITYLPAGSLPLVIEDLLGDLQGRSDSYFHGLSDKDGIVRAMASSVRDLRMSGITSADLSPVSSSATGRAATSGNSWGDTSGCCKNGQSRDNLSNKG